MYRDFLDAAVTPENQQFIIQLCSMCCSQVVQAALQPKNRLVTLSSTNSQLKVSPFVRSISINQSRGPRHSHDLGPRPYETDLKNGKAEYDEQFNGRSLQTLGPYQSSAGFQSQAKARNGFTNSLREDSQQLSVGGQNMDRSSEKTALVESGKLPVDKNATG